MPELIALQVTAFHYLGRNRQPPARDHPGCFGTANRVPEMALLTPLPRKILVAGAAASSPAAIAMIDGRDTRAGLLGLPSDMQSWSGVTLILVVTMLGMIMGLRRARATA